MKAGIVAIFFLTCVFSSAFGQDVLPIRTDIGWLEARLRKKISVNLVDSVKGGCWSNSNTAKTAVSLELVRSGYVVAENEAAQVLMWATGYNSGNRGCVSSYGFSFQIYGNEQRSAFSEAGVLPLQSYHTRNLFERSGVMTGPGDLSDRLATEFQSISQEFLVTVSTQNDALQSEILALNEPHKSYWRAWLARLKTN